jgi:cytochrome b561
VEEITMKSVQTFRYPFAVRWIHWLGVAAIATAYLTSESAEELMESGSGTNWHVVAGIGLVLLFVPRLLARLSVGKRPHTSGAEKWVAGTLQLALLLFMLVQPLLGVLAVWAEGHSLAIPFTSFELVPMVRLEGWGHSLEEMHEIVGNVFYGVIAIHVLAALWHQFVSRDELIQRML